MNKVILLGRLTKEPEIRYTQTNNTMVATYNLAVNKRFTKQGEERQSNFFPIVAYSKLAEFSQKNLTKGLQICVCGRLQTRNWEDGNAQKHYITEIIAEELYFADSNKKNQGPDESILYGNAKATNNENMSEDVISNADDIPF